MGSFSPFTTGREEQLDAYLREIVVRLSENQDLQVKADFGSYGSGYASYVPVNISKADKSDTATLATGKRVVYKTQGLLLYLSRLVPYWCCGASSWTENYEHGRCTGGSHTFLEPAHLSTLDAAAWGATRQWLATVLAEYGYAQLTQPAVSQPAPASITVIPTILTDAPYQVFDCFFYWED